ncbi:MAG TPA: hypothetical protein DEB39_10010 [Planctomycetaceae bacterium]|nr:hypothetical protein [Planctomycetaceae bacterium]
MSKKLLLFTLAIFSCSFLPAQESPLSQRQKQLSERYSQLENVLLRMAEINARTNPKRAALLKKVLAESKDRLIDMRFDELVAILAKHRLTEAIDGQETLERDLAELLKLLESENRAGRRDAEKEKIAKLIRELDELIHREKAIRGKTQRSDRFEAIEKEQADVRDRADKLSDKMSESQEIGPRSDNRSDNRSDRDPESDDPDEVDPEEVDKSRSPTQQAMQKGMRRMRAAGKRLRESKKAEAIEEQEEAISELQKAKAELEKILRQLREEELMQTLLWLDARVKKMLRAEKSIHSQTENAVGFAPGNEGGGGNVETNAETEETIRARTIRLSRLAADQSLVIVDADAALIVLREDGTAQAMGESLLQARFDMEEVRLRLNRGEASPTTLRVEQAVIDALEEMLEALDLAKKDAERRQQQQQPGAPGGPADQRLLNILSELKMIRLMQARVYERTQRYETMLVEPGADLPALQTGVEELARQQTRIGRILNSIEIGKNE